MEAVISIDNLYYQMRTVISNDNLHNQMKTVYFKRKTSLSKKNCNFRIRICICPKRATAAAAGNEKSNLLYSFRSSCNFFFYKNFHNFPYFWKSCTDHFNFVDMYDMFNFLTKANQL